MISSAQIKEAILKRLDVETPHVSKAVSLFTDLVESYFDRRLTTEQLKEQIKNNPLLCDFFEIKSDKEVNIGNYKLVSRSEAGEKKVVIDGSGNIAILDSTIERSVINTGNFIHLTINAQSESKITAQKIAGAQKLLSRLPEKSIPKDNSPQNPFIIPYHRNRNFVGREKYFRKFAAVAKRSGTSAILFHGIGGVGKSQLAVELCYKYGKYFSGGVFWINFEEPASIASQVIKCGGVRGLNLYRDDEDFSPEVKINRVKNFWTSGIPSLLVFDNCSDKTLLDEWLPTHGECCVIITSRSSKLSSYLNIYPENLEQLSPEESVRLLRLIRPDKKKENRPQNYSILRQIADALGHLPLALHLAGCYMEATKAFGSPAEYLEKLRAPPLLKDESLQDNRNGDSSPTKHAWSVEKTFQISYALLESENEIDSLARDILSRISFFAPGEPLPVALIPQIIEKNKTGVDKDKLSLSLRRLSEIGIFTENTKDELISLHRLLADFSKIKINRLESDKIQIQVTDVIMDLVYGKIKYAPLFELQNHISFIAERGFHFYYRKKDYDFAAYIRIFVDRWLFQWGKYDRLIKQYEQIVDKITDEKRKIFSLIYLGQLYELNGNKKSIACYRKALKLTSSFPALQKHEAGVLHQTGNYYYTRGNYKQAIKYFENALESIARQRHQIESLKIKVRLNIANCNLYLGNIDAGEKIYRKIAEEIRDIDENIYKNIRVECLINLGYCNFIVGESAAAMIIYEEAARMAKEMGNLPRQLQIMCHKGDILIRKSGFIQSGKILKRCLKKSQEIGAIEIESLTLQGLAEAEIYKSNYSQAIDLAKKGLEAGLKTHNPVISCQNYLSLAHANLYVGDWSAAKTNAVLAQKKNLTIYYFYAVFLEGLAELKLDNPNKAKMKINQSYKMSAGLLNKNSRNIMAQMVYQLAYTALLPDSQASPKFAAAVYKSIRTINKEPGFLKRCRFFLSLIGKSRFSFKEC
ncbi:MAG TPA: NB-ARC domain-containing protein [Pyrinomonadaceae bacterium]